MASILLAGFLTPALARQPISVLIDGMPINMDAMLLIRGGRTMVTFLALAKALGVYVTWDGAANKK